MSEAGEIKIPDVSDETPIVYKVIGAPGTGKTTRVVGNTELEGHESLIQKNLKHYGIKEQAIVTYTKAGVEEAQERLIELHDYNKGTIRSQVMTIHAHCYRALDVDQDQVVRWWHKQNFCEMMDMEYGNDGDDGDIMSSDNDEGHAFFQIYEWVKNNMHELEDWTDCPAQFPSEKDFVEVARRWEEYKKEGGGDKTGPELIEFHDMIEKTVEQGMKMLHNDGYPSIFGDPPEDPMETFKQTNELERFEPREWRGKGPWLDVKVLYVDEVQDLFPLQWAWYLMQKLVCEKTYIGGDDDQTIYGWAGADPSFMLDEEGDFEVLDKTYRIPKEIWEECNGVIQQVDKRQEKEVEPHGEGGEVHKYANPDPEKVIEHLKEGECMALFRANYMIDEFRESLHEHGVPYRNMSTFDTWSDEVVAVRDALAKLEKGEEKLNSDEVEALMDNAIRECKRCYGDGCSECDYEGEKSMVGENSGFNATESAMADLGGMEPTRAKSILNVKGNGYKGRSRGFDVYQYLRESEGINYYEKQAIKGSLDNGTYNLYPDRLRIGTIHSSKGKEAETVMVALDSTQQILGNMADDTRDDPNKRISDPERRVYYVGMTRASEELVLAQGLVNPDSTIKLENLLNNGGNDNNNWASEGSYQSQLR